MKRNILFLLLIVTNFLFAKDSLKVQKGWNNISFLSEWNIKKFTNIEKFKYVWYFNPVNQKWYFYSSDNSILNTIQKKNFEIIPDKLPNYSAIWVFSDKSVTISVTDFTNESNSFDKNVTITAADAYVVALPKPATVTINDKTFNSVAVKNGVITFTVPANADVTAAEFYVPENAIVDIDGDGKLSIKDQVIRMPLRTRGERNVANPIATAALARDDNKTFEAAKNFDPVKAKKQLILNPDDPKTKAFVAISDGIAELVKKAKEKGIDSKEVIKEVNTEIVQQVVSDPEMVTTQNITDVVQEVVKTAAEKVQVDAVEVAQKVQKVIEVIETAAQAVKEGKVDPEKALVAIVAVSDADLDPEVAKQAIQEGNVSENKIIVENVEHE